MIPTMGNPIRLKLGGDRGPVFHFADGSAATGPRVYYSGCRLKSIGFDTSGDDGCEAAVWAGATIGLIVRSEIASA